MYIRKLFFACLFVIAVAIVTTGCKMSSLTRDDIVNNDFAIITIDSVMNINASNLYYRLSNSDLVEGGGILDSSTYFDTLRAILIDSLVSLEARDVNLKDDPVLYRNFTFRYYDYYVKYLYDRLILDSIHVDSLQVDSFASAHPESFAYWEQVRAKHLVISAEGYRKGPDSAEYKDFSDEQLDSIAHDKTIELRAMIDTGADFGYLAYEYSMHRESGQSDGELGYFTRDKYRKEFNDVVFSLPIGTISQPFKTPDGWHIVEIIDHIDSGQAPLTPEIYGAAEDQLKRSLAFERSMRLIDSLVSAAQIEYNEAALSSDIHSVPATEWAAAINKRDTITFFRMPDYLHAYKGQRGLDTITVDDIKNSLDYRARSFLIMQAGDDLGYDEDSLVAAFRNNLYHKYAVDFVEKDRGVINYMPPDSLIEDYYQKNIDKYVYDKPIYVQHIIAEDSLFAEYLRDQALSGVDFLELAKENYPGAEEIRVAAADLGYIGPGEMPDNFYNVAMGTAVKGVSRPVKTEWGYHIIKVIDKRANKTVDHVKGEIIKELTERHRAEVARQFDREIISRHSIEYNLEPIKRIELASKDRR